MLPHPARPALPRPGIDHNRFPYARPRRPNLPGQLEHPRPQLIGLLDSLPRPVAQDNEKVVPRTPYLIFGVRYGVSGTHAELGMVSLELTCGVRYGVPGVHETRPLCPVLMFTNIRATVALPPETRWA